MAGIVDVHDPARAFPGLTLANVITGNATNEPLVLVLLGMDGRPVWTFTGPMGSGRGDIQASWVGDRHILVGGGFEAGVRPFLMDLQGSLLWEGPEQPGGDGPVPDLLVEGTMHHVFQPVYDGTFVVLENTIRDNVIGDRIRHFDKMLKPLWIWDAFEHLPDPRTVALGQWLHSNSVVLEPATDHVLLSCMALGRIFKLSRPDGQVLWALGEGGDFQADPDAKHPWFYGGHGLKRLPDGHLLFYDNGTVKRGFSRVVEYALDEEARTATIAWEYPGTFTGETWFNGAMGDVDPLPNGNVLIAAGNGVQHQSPSRLMEVARDGTRVWQMWWYNSPNLRAGCYQVERIPPLSLPLDR